MIRRIYFIGIMCMLAVFSLINMSGLGVSLKTDNLLRYIIYFFAIFTFFILHKKSKKIADFSDVFLVLFTILIFESSSVLGGYPGSGLLYLSFYVCVYLIAMQEFKSEYLFYTSMIFMVYGTGILILLKYTDFLSGWNSNTLSIICFQSFMIFFATFNANSFYKKIFYYCIAVINVILLAMLDCRSAMLCIILAVFLSMRIEIAKKTLNKRWTITILLLIPLFVAVSVVILSNQTLSQKLNEWSVNVFSKGIFNGRDKIWLDGFTQLAKKPFFGSGYINSGYWHNSAVACLTSYGIIGYALYIFMFNKLLCSGTYFIYDDIVAKCILAFLIINFQQSFENTLFLEGSIYFPYVLLGVLMGRIRYLKGKNTIEENQYNYTGLQYR